MYVLCSHERIHLEKKEHSCQYCGKAFVQKCNLKVLYFLKIIDTCGKYIFLNRPTSESTLARSRTPASTALSGSSKGRGGTSTRRRASESKRLLTVWEIASFRRIFPYIRFRPPPGTEEEEEKKKPKAKWKKGAPLERKSSKKIELKPPTPPLPAASLLSSPPPAATTAAALLLQRQQRQQQHLPLSASSSAASPLGSEDSQPGLQQQHQQYTAYHHQYMQQFPH